MIHGQLDSVYYICRGCERGFAHRTVTDMKVA